VLARKTPDILVIGNVRNKGALDTDSTRWKLARHVSKNMFDRPDTLGF
jgi:hypothetical protein